MFFDELGPVWQELTQSPVAFMGGFVSGLLRLNLDQDPVKSWLDEDQPTGSNSDPSSSQASPSTKGPQSITID
ncbi:MAG: hypothetical protein AAGF24_03025 [Cyanobacteria bacterium P01_H01_bin.121]